ncbi:Ig-like domain repeat protein [Solirubrobacter soli]|uniref:Ig-like domain repeat protein n=1 Tax=Solirubrobacter soli TaxID=363832 RepID=UPI0003F973F7|nr:Ig-like domain repeat protein [Solirubrobacter soli]
MRKFGAVLAAAMAMLCMTSTASAGIPPTNVGPPDLTVNAPGTVLVGMTWLNLTSDGSTSYSVPFDGRLTSFKARMNSCPGSCHLRLLVLRESVAPSYQVIAASQPMSGVAGVNTFTTSLDVLQGDQLALEWDNGSVKAAMPAGATNSYWEGAVGASPTVTFDDSVPGFTLLYNAQLIVPVSTTVAVDAPSSPVLGGQTTYNVHVDRATGSDRSVIGGTVSLSDGGTPIAACQSVPVTAGEASCSAAVTGNPGNRTITATYSGDSPFESSTSGPTHVNVKAVTATTAAVAGSLEPGAGITYTATVTPPPSTGYISALAQANKGTVAFSVDGTAIADCATRAVNATTGEATCTTTAPATGADHTVKAVYSGGTFYTGSQGEAAFTLKQTGVSVPATADAGSVTVGSTGSTRVTLTSTGTLAVRVAAARVSDGDFSVAADTCSGTAVAAGATCTVDVAFKPSAPGSRTATLTFSDSVAEHAVALTGVGTPAPTPPAPPTGAVFAPGRSTSLSTTSHGELSVPVRCPDAQACSVDGTVTVTTGTAARAAAAGTATVARFARVHIAGGKVKKLKLRLDPGFVRKARKQGIRRVRATLTINTTLGSGAKVTTTQRITIVLPKAQRKQAKPRFTGL